MALGEPSNGSLRGSPPPTVLVTSADSTVGNTLVRALTGRARLLAAAADRDAPALYLVPRSNRLRLPSPHEPDYAQRVLEAAFGLHADVVVPVEADEQAALAPLADAFAAAGIGLVCESAEALHTSADLLLLGDRCADRVRMPAWVHLTPDVRAADLRALGQRVVVRLRAGGARCGVIDTADEQRLALLPRDGELVAQAYLPGPDCDIDVVVGPDGSPAVAVPHVRRRRDGGRLVTDRTVRDPEMQSFAASVVETLELRWVGSVRARRNPAGQPALVSVTSGFSESIGLGLAAGVNLPALVLARAQGTVSPRPQFDEVDGPVTRAPVVVSLDAHRRLVSSRQRRTG